MAETGTETGMDGIERLAARLSVESGRRYPPVEKWNPAHEGTVDIRIAADGTWYHEGEPIRRANMVRLFSTVLRRDADGHHYLVTPVEKMRITVDVAPLHVVDLQREGEGEAQTIAFRTMTDDLVVLDADHPLGVTVDPATGEPTPLVLVRGRLQALLSRPVYYDLVELAEVRHLAQGEVLGVMSAGQFHVIGRTDGTPL
ncbi:MAG: DUF1285 domain-containing protein [Pseudomonadota bacterium]|nr:DUF1285 domain-containing protein [Pseudomonadota bacterium]